MALHGQCPVFGFVSFGNSAGLQMAFPACLEGSTAGRAELTAAGEKIEQKDEAEKEKVWDRPFNRSKFP